MHETRAMNAAEPKPTFISAAETLKRKGRLAAIWSDRIQVGVPVLACWIRLPDKPVSYGNEGQTDGRTACTACSERETEGDPGIYTLMKTTMGNMLICLTVVG